MSNSATLVQALGAAFCAILCALSGMGGGGMMIGARTAAWAKSGGWVNPYVTDDLVAMWDGEWNAGGGMHDPNATKIKDLSGNNYDLNLYLASIFEKHINFSGTNARGYGSGFSKVANGFEGKSITVEIVFCSNKYVESSGIWLNSQNGTSNSNVPKVVQRDNAVVRWIFANGDFNNMLNPPAVGELSNLTVSIDGPAVKIYKNGTINRILNLTGQNARSEWFVVCGPGYYNNSNVDNDFFRCSIYNKAKTAEEIAANFAVDDERFDIT